MWTLILLAVLNILDFFTTYIGVGILGIEEGNPLSLWAIEQSWLFYLMIKTVMMIGMYYVIYTVTNNDKLKKHYNISVITATAFLMFVITSNIMVIALR